jgi:hypothetical protein
MSKGAHGPINFACNYRSTAGVLYTAIDLYICTLQKEYSALYFTNSVTS